MIQDLIWNVNAFRSDHFDALLLTEAFRLTARTHKGAGSRPLRDKRQWVAERLETSA